MRGHALAGGDFLGGCFLLGGWGMVFLRAPAQRLFAYAQYDTPSPRGAPRLGRKDMGKMPAQQALKVVWRCVFCGRPLKDSSLTLIVTGESASLKMRADKNLSPDYEIGVFLLKLCGA